MNAYIPLGFIMVGVSLFIYCLWQWFFTKYRNDSGKIIEQTILKTGQKINELDWSEKNIDNEETDSILNE